MSDTPDPRIEALEEAAAIVDRWRVEAEDGQTFDPHFYEALARMKYAAEEIRSMKELP